MEIFFYFLFPVLKYFSGDNKPEIVLPFIKTCLPPYQLEAGEH